MSIGTFFLFAASVLFFFAAVGVALIPAPAAWGMVCLTVGILTAGIPVPSWHK